MHKRDNGNEAGLHLEWKPPEIDANSVKTGDMPGDKVQINQTHIEKANIIFPRLLQKLESLDGQRLVVSVYGGSGSGKSEIGSILGYYYNQQNYASYILSGDNYPRRVPKFNDNERLTIYRNAGLNALAKNKQFSNDWMVKLHQKWPDMEDINPKTFTSDESVWMNEYFNAGKEALASYLGTEKETDFSMVNHIIKLFKAGENRINLKRMGRTTEDIRYEAVDFSGVRVLIIEWTHGNNKLLAGVDFPIFLFSSPAETLAHRLARGRDKNTDSPLINLVLELEQEKLISQAGTAKLIISKNGELISLAELHNRLT
ncbi:MAG: adenylylsulfate kinase [Chloroflexi bacterium]|nr:MAG: adenylylsulfate kinase [Chloroflexota bacterium]